MTSLAAATKVVGDRGIPTVIMDNGLRRLFFPPEKLVARYVSRGQVVADMGCGPGFFALPIAKIVRGSPSSESSSNAGKVYAVDFDSKSIEKLKIKAVKRGYAEIIEARVSSASKVNFIPSASLDFVFANGLLCCMNDHLGAVQEINRILKKGTGKAYLSVSKYLLRNDPRSVTKEEWQRLLSENFAVLKEGEGLFSRWALVSPSGRDIDESLPNGQEEKGQEEGKQTGQRFIESCSCCASP